VSAKNLKSRKCSADGPSNALAGASKERDILLKSVEDERSLVTAACQSHQQRTVMPSTGAGTSWA
jgi:hypothetical protein